MSADDLRLPEDGRAARVSPRAGVDRVPPYVAGEAKVEGFARVVRLASNESPLGPSPRAAEAYRAWSGEIERYPDPAAVELRQAIAAKFGLAFDQILCACGSEELLHLAARAFLDTGDRAVIGQYGFMAHRVASLAAGAEVVMAPEPELRVDLDAMLDAVTPQTRLLYLSNPGNPTGTMVDAADVEAFHAHLPGHVVLVLDAAYAEFAEHRQGYAPGFSLVDAGAENVLVTRTFSKMYGLAGLRIGWGYGSPAVVDYINRIRPAFNAGSAGQQAAIAALGDDAFVERCRSVNDEGLSHLRADLAALGVPTTDSVCNFVLARLPGGEKSAAAAYDFLKARGVLVRPVAGYGLPDHLRISVGLEADNTALLDGVEAFMASS